MSGPEFRSLEPTQMPGGYGHPRPFQQGVSLSKLAKQTNLAILSGSRRPYYNEQFRKQLMKTPSVKLHLTCTRVHSHSTHTHIHSTYTYARETEKCTLHLYYVYVVHRLFQGWKNWICPSLPGAGSAFVLADYLCSPSLWHASVQSLSSHMKAGNR